MWDSRTKGGVGGDRNDNWSKKTKHYRDRDLTQGLGHESKLIHPAGHFQLGGISGLGEKEAEECCTCMKGSASAAEQQLRK